MDGKKYVWYCGICNQAHPIPNMEVPEMFSALFKDFDGGIPPAKPETKAKCPKCGELMFCVEA